MRTRSSTDLTPQPSPTQWALSSPARSGAMLEVEQRSFELETASKAGKRAIAGPHSMTGDQDRDRVRCARRSDSASRPRPAQFDRELTVGTLLAKRYAPDLAPDALLKGSTFHDQGNRELAKLTGQVRLNLGPRGSGEIKSGPGSHFSGPSRCGQAHSGDSFWGGLYFDRAQHGDEANCRGVPRHSDLPDILFTILHLQDDARWVPAVRLVLSLTPVTRRRVGAGSTSTTELESSTVQRHSPAEFLSARTMLDHLDESDSVPVIAANSATAWALVHFEPAVRARRR